MLGAGSVKPGAALGALRDAGLPSPLPRPLPALLPAGMQGRG